MSSSFSTSKEEGGGQVAANVNLLKLEDIKVEDVDDQKLTWFLTEQQQIAVRNFVKNFSAQGELLRADSNALRDAFGNIIFEVFDILEDDHVVIFKSPQNNIIILVTCETTARSYWIRPGVSQCPCMGILGKHQFCKHVLAAHIQLGLQDPEKCNDISDQKLLQFSNALENELLSLSRVEIYSHENIFL
ncbi:unnamed protein product [Orchesella dallaii]|uniref:SWIM-type domain-containing protein n=1 Tax=Orchesella dallaii TaxID=48710 RepID=A0ABP1R9K5_9HEXA